MCTVDIQIEIEKITCVLLHVQGFQRFVRRPFVRDEHFDLFSLSACLKTLDLAWAASPLTRNIGDIYCVYKTVLKCG